LSTIRDRHFQPERPGYVASLQVQITLVHLDADVTTRLYGDICRNAHAGQVGDGRVPIVAETKPRKSSQRTCIDERSFERSFRGAASDLVAYQKFGVSAAELEMVRRCTREIAEQFLTQRTGRIFRQTWGNKEERSVRLCFFDINFACLVEAGRHETDLYENVSISKQQKPDTSFNFIGCGKYNLFVQCGWRPNDKYHR
jgi:hypothetical protein